MTVAVADRKAWVTLQAELALAGWQAVLTERDTGGIVFSVGRWGQTRTFDDLADARKWASQVVTRRRSASDEGGPCGRSS